MYRVKEDDTMSAICERFNTSKENILRNNSEIELYAGEWVEITVNDYLIHTVKPMESLKVISEKYAMNQDKIMLDNNLKSNKLFIGQCLKIYNKTTDKSNNF